MLGIQKDSIGRSYEDKPTNNGIKNSNLNSRESNSSPIKKSVIQTPQKPTQHTYPQYQSYPSTFVSYKKQQQTQLDRPQPPTSQTMSPDLFQPLTNLLRGLAREGEAFPLRSMVCERLSKKVYKDIGASRWADYAQAAELSGAVVLGIHEGRVGTEWVALPEEMKKKEEQDRKQLEIQNGKVQREKEHRIFVQKEKERLEQSKKQEDVRLVPRAVTVTAANAVKESITQQTGASSKAPVSKENGSTSLLSGGNSEDAKKEVASSQKTKNGDVLPSTAASTTLTVKPFLRDEPWNGKLTMPVDRFYPLFEIMKQLASDYSESSTGSSNSTNSSSVSEDPIARASKVQKSLAYLKQQNVFDSYSASGVNDFQEFMKVAEEQGVARLRLKIKEKKLSKFLESDGKDKGKGKAKEEGENENENENDSAIKGREIVVLREKFKRAYTGVPTKGAERMEDTTTATLPEEKPKRSSSPIKKAFKKTLFGDSKADATEEKLVDPIVTHKPSNLPIRKSLLPLVNLLNNQLLLSRNFVVPSFLHKSLLKLPSSEIKIMRVKNKDEFLDFLTRAENDGVIEISKGFNEGEEQVRLSKQFHGVQTRNVGQDYQAQREFRGNEEFLAEEKENGKGKPKEEEEWVDEEEGQTQKDGLSDGAFGGLASGAFNWFANNQDLASMNPIGADSTKMKKARSHSPSKKSTSKISQQESEEDLGELVGRGGTSKAGNGKAEDEEDEEVLEWGNYAKRV